MSKSAMLAGRVCQMRRIVLKIGSELVDSSGTPNKERIESIAQDMAELQSQNLQFVLVCSGAVAIGRRRITKRPVLRNDEKKAAASIGQIPLTMSWYEQLTRYGLTPAQILLTLGDTENRRAHLNARDTLETLLAAGTVPILNENDTIATIEARYGDNDRLAARIAVMVKADLLVLFSNIDGLYTADPKRKPAARHIAEISEITDTIMAMARGAKLDSASSGGMITKLEAARIATESGCAMAIVDGRPAHALAGFVKGEARHSFFPARRSGSAARKRWIAGMITESGIVTIDEGAAKAIKQGKSLLFAGIVSVSGDFGRGDVVRIQNLENRRIAKGLAACSSQSAQKAKGLRSAQTPAILGAGERAWLVHSDDMVVF